MLNYGGKTIKGYAIGDELGAGGFGAVYQAHQAVLKRDVAIKVILHRFEQGYCQCYSSRSAN